MQKKQNSKNEPAEWLGESADKKVLLEHFKRTFIDKPLAEKFHYAFTYPGEKRSPELLYTLRICSFELQDGETVEMRGAFDGIVAVADIHDGDILCGSYNAVTRPVDPAASYGGFSIVFHTHHVRLHYVRFIKGEITENIYCYTDRPCDGALQMICQALDIAIHNVESRRDAICRALTDALVNQLYSELLQSFDSMPDEASRMARRIKYFLECNFSESINCSLLCDELGVNRSYASQIFHRNFGVTMSDYLAGLRIDAAKKLLTSSGGLKISEIAELCGFQDAGYFSRAFRRREKCTPLEFRKKQQPG